MRADRNELKAASFISMLWIPSACYLLGSLRRFPHDATQELQDQQHHTPSSLSAALQPLQTQSWGPRRCADAAAGRFHVVTSWGDQRLPPHFLQSFTLTGFCSRLDNDICKHSECCIIISNQRKKLRSGLRNAQLSGTLPGRVLTRSRTGGGQDFRHSLVNVISHVSTGGDHPLLQVAQRNAAELPRMAFMQQTCHLKEKLPSLDAVCRAATVVQLATALMTTSLWRFGRSFPAPLKTTISIDVHRAVRL